ncbi:hypothetical protein B0H10DRAFT_1948514 [Mycena sp. CBHHK59/15]|nr:hypothetical protein B0H10DRAFT_1948514 [Mycena sp. CBHHK59/15]
MSAPPSCQDDANATLDVTTFGADGFTDFKLDLSCLSSTPSPPPSPSPFSSDFPFSSYLPSSPPASTRRSVSFSTGPSPSLGRAPSEQRPSTSPRISFTSQPAGSWPLARYVGRGTPIDRSRRSEWGGEATEDGVLNDEGVLFSTVRSTSVDSAPRPSSSQRSISPLAEWNYISPPLVTVYSPRSRSAVSLEPLPEALQIHLDGVSPNSSAEWASSMQEVLASPISASAASTSTSETRFESAEELPDPEPEVEEQAVEGAQVDVEPEAEGEEEDLGLSSLSATVDQGLGLGLIPGGMTWFDVGILPAVASRSSVSVYSCDEHTATPHVGSRPHSVAPSEGKTPLREKIRSQLWWRRFLSRLRQIRLAVSRGRR